MDGFFKASELISKAPMSRIPQCGSCGLHKACNSPKMPVSGEGRRKILLVGEAPGKKEDERGIQFTGPTGQLLEKTLSRHGINMRKDCWLTNSLICRPPKNETPTPKQISYCQPNLINTIDKLKPDIIVPIGGPAVDSLISYVWKDKVGSIARWVGWKIPCQKPNAWIVPIWHPSFIARQKDPQTGFVKRPEIELIWNEHIEALNELEGKPWKKVPNYKDKVKIITDPTDAANIIREFIRRGGRAAYDYECNALKPDWPECRIICCSISLEGEETIAYPWYGDAIDATKEFVRSDIGKIASNLKYEERWTNRILKTRTKNWIWDTMLNAHILDCRREVTGLKFQSFALLGQESYNDPIEPFLRSKGDSRVNRIVKEIELKQLLQYCGLDSLLEFKVAEIQSKRLGVKL